MENPKISKDKVPAPVGESITRVDAYDKVTGAAIFTDDIQFGPGLLFARIKRSPYPHAKILKIDGSKALALPGVKAIVTGKDYPGYTGLYLQDRQVFATEKTRCVGEPVVGVAAITEELAEKALDLIDVEYEPMPAVLDPEFGASKESPLIHPKLGEYTVANFIFPQAGTNISNHFKIRKGDVDGAWKDCAAIVEHRYQIPHVQHVPIETHIVIARAEDSGKITLWSTSQSPFAQRNLIAQALGISHRDIEVIAPYVGGGFGCKAGASMESLIVAIAMKVRGHPVKLRLTREEEFFTAFVRQGLVAYHKMGCDKNGNILAMETKFYWDSGAYTEYAVNMTRASGYSSTGPYDVPNVKTDSYCVYTNHPVTGPMRGFGMPEIHVGLEQCIDELAYKIKMDPVEFRKLNCVQGGDIIVTGMVMHPVGLTECIEKAAKAIEWGKKEKPSSPNKLRGKGIAIMWKAPAMPPNAGSSAWIELNEDATLTLGLGGQEIGQGTHTVMSQMAAGALGVPVESVRIARPVDTDVSPYEWQTVASRLTWSMGNAVVRAARDARQQILETVAKAWKEDPDDLDIVNGVVISYKSEQSISLKDIVIYGIPQDNCNSWVGGPIVGRGSFMPSYVTGLDPETGQGSRAVVHYTTGCQAVELEVDTLTGRVEILKAVGAFDVGKAINPDLVKTQMEGGFGMGLSTAFFEGLKLKDGVLQNPSFVDYRIATTADAPLKIESIIVEVPQDDGPYGARGVGEHSMVPTIPAIANAIFDATGVRVGSPPYLPEKVYLALVDAGVVK
ncbi:MAG: xanthine dehydrogenase family protein molybdopterin-binding subunit [Anaerolineaceae bacterium]|nr:xanthine dehydrogenase family protein molybdopterin-binding subunit [Anaerolineaceae bacterium]